MNGSSVETMIELIPSINALLATKYLAGKLLLDRYRQSISVRSINSLGSAIVVTMWDAMISLDQEVHCIWQLVTGVTKIVFWLNRYGMMGVLLYTNYSTCSYSYIQGVANPDTYIQCSVGWDTLELI